MAGGAGLLLNIQEGLRLPQQEGRRSFLSLSSPAGERCQVTSLTRQRSPLSSVGVSPYAHLVPPDLP